MKTLVLCLGLMLSGCASVKWIERTYQPEKSGLISYPTDQGYYHAKRNKEKMNEMISQFCGSDKYTITKEIFGAGVNGARPNNDASVSALIDNGSIGVSFVCR